MEKGNRSNDDILRDMIDAVIEYKACVEDERNFIESEGDRDLWDTGTAGTYGEILDAKRNAEEQLRELVVEATGDEDFCW